MRSSVHSDMHSINILCRLLFIAAAAIGSTALFGCGQGFQAVADQAGNSISSSLADNFGAVQLVVAPAGGEVDVNVGDTLNVSVTIATTNVIESASWQKLNTTNNTYTTVSGATISVDLSNSTTTDLLSLANIQTSASGTYRASVLIKSLDGTSTRTYTSDLVQIVVGGSSTPPAATATPKPTATPMPTATPAPATGSDTCPARPSVNPGKGFYVVSGKICDANGNEFRLRGMNKAHYDEDQHAALLAAHANVVRLFMYNITPSGANGNGLTSGDYANMIINQYADNDIVTILTAANIPGGGVTSGNHSTTDLATVVKWWVANVNAFKTAVNGKVPMDYMILNVANEWNPTNTDWQTGYKAAVVALRNAGYTCPILMDAGQGGNSSNLTNYSAGVAAADPQKNSIFSDHQYGETTTAQLDNENAAMARLATSTGAAYIIGEFGPGRGMDNATVTPNQIIASAESHDIGWLFWGIDDHDQNGSQSDNNWFDACYIDFSCNSATHASPSTKASLDSTLYTIAGQEVVLGCTNATPGGCGCSNSTTSLSVVHPGCPGTLSPKYSGQGMVDLAKPATIFK